MAILNFFHKWYVNVFYNALRKSFYINLSPSEGFFSVLKREGTLKTLTLCREGS